jgi:hypothetical protein
MVREIPLTRGKTALVDDEDFDALSRFKWRADRSKRVHGEDGWYAVRSVYFKSGGVKKVRVIRMHREILELPSDVDGEHVDGNGLNNQRFNIRPCANDSLNQANRTRMLPNASSRFRGVTRHTQTGRWQAQIKVNGVNHFLGLFRIETEAAAAYDHAARVNFGEFARLNLDERIAA